MSVSDKVPEIPTQNKMFYCNSKAESYPYDHSLPVSVPKNMDINIKQMKLTP